jgi:hypothetical protein
MGDEHEAEHALRRGVEQRARHVARRQRPLQADADGEVEVPLVDLRGQE